MWNLKYKTNEHTYKTETGLTNIDLWLPRWELEEERIGSLRLIDANYCI